MKRAVKSLIVCTSIAVYSILVLGSMYLNTFFFFLIEWPIPMLLWHIEGERLN